MGTAPTYEFHEIADIFPAMREDEYAALRDDIKANGLLEPIWLYRDKIIDGRNRYRACVELGIEPIVRVWTGKDPVAFVVGLNLHRRHLNESQRAMVASKLATLGKGRRESNSSIDPLKNSETEFSQSKAAETLNVGTASVKRAKHVQEKGTPELAKAVESGNVPVSAAAIVADLPKPEQAKIIAKGPAAVKAKAAAIRKSKPKAKAKADGPAGKTKVNGVLVDDPPDIAKARKAGRIAIDVVPEVDEPSGDAGSPETPPDDKPEITDADWLNTLPTRAKLSENSRVFFDRDALAYRKCEEARGKFAHAVRSILAAADRRGSLPSYLFRLRSFLKINHPKDWAICPPTEYGGCGGKGVIDITGTCTKCHGGGYTI